MYAKYSLCFELHKTPKELDDISIREVHLLMACSQLRNPTDEDIEKNKDSAKTIDKDNAILAEVEEAKRMKARRAKGNG